MDRSIPTGTMAWLAGISIAEVVEDGSAVMICVQTSCAAYEPSRVSGASTPTVRAPCDASACSPATHALKRDVTGLLCDGASCVEGGDDQAMCCDALPQTTEAPQMTLQLAPRRASGEKCLSEMPRMAPCVLDGTRTRTWGKEK